MPFGFYADEPVRATEDERAELTALLRVLEDGANGSNEARPRLSGAGGEQVAVPETVRRLLHRIVQTLAKGDAVMFVPVHQTLTTQQAADLLNVSRPYVIQILDRGELPYTRTGSHRRIRLDDVMAYRDAQERQRREALRELTELSQELGLYNAPEHAGR